MPYHVGIRSLVHVLDVRSCAYVVVVFRSYCCGDSSGFAAYSCTVEFLVLLHKLAWVIITELDQCSFYISQVMFRFYL